VLSHAARRATSTLSLHDALPIFRTGAGAVDDCGVVLVDDHLLGAAKHADRDVLEFGAEFLTDHIAGGKNGNILQHRLAAIAEARSEEHTSELQSRENLVCRLLLE